MRAIILAAGQGKRILPLTKDIPKCLLDVGGISILEYQLQICEKLKINEIYIVVGFKFWHIMRKIGNSVTYIINKNYATTNSLYSFWLAKEIIQDDIIVLNSDVIFHEHILRQLIKSKENNIISADFRKDFTSEDMKIRVDGDKRLLEISKDIEDSKAMAENLGIVKLSKGCAKVLIDTVEPIIHTTARNKWFPYGLNLISDHQVIKCMDIMNYPWIEIDFIEDYEKAKNIIYPKILKLT